MQKYTVGYTEHDGTRVVLAEGNNIQEIAENLPFDATVWVDGHVWTLGTDDFPKLTKVIQEHTGEHAWIRRAPYTMSERDISFRLTKWTISAETVEDLVIEILKRSDRFAEEVQAEFGERNIGPEDSDEVRLHVDARASRIFVYVRPTHDGFEITRCDVLVTTTKEDLEAFAKDYSNNEDGSLTAVELYTSGVEEVARLARLVEHYEQRRRVAVRNAYEYEYVPQRSLARAANVSQSTIHRWINSEDEWMSNY